MTTTRQAPQAEQTSDSGYRIARSAISHAVGAVLLGVLACVGVVVLGWATDPAGATAWPQAVRVGIGLWVVGHLGTVDVLSEVVTSASPADAPSVVSGVVSLAPGLLVVLAGLLAARVGVRVAERGRLPSTVVAVGLVAAVYAAAAWVLAWASDTAQLAADPTRAALGAGGLIAVAAGAGAGRVHAGHLLAGLPRAASNQLRRVAGGAVVATVSWLTAGAALLGGALAYDVAGVSDIQSGLAPGVGGGALLLLLQVAYLPTLVVWAASLLAGPGVVLGSGALNAGGSTVLDSPAVPILAALPQPGAFALWAWGGALLVVGAGALAGWHTHRHPSSRGATAVDRILDSAAVAAVAGLLVLPLTFAASGSLGSWGPLGPDPLLVSGALVAELFVGCLISSAVLHLLSGRAVTAWRLPASWSPKAAGRL